MSLSQSALRKDSTLFRVELPLQIITLPKRYFNASYGIFIMRQWLKVNGRMDATRPSDWIIAFAAVCCLLLMLLLPLCRQHNFSKPNRNGQYNGGRKTVRLLNHINEIGTGMAADRKYYSKNYIYHSMYPFYHFSFRYINVNWHTMVMPRNVDTDRINLLCRHNTFSCISQLPIAPPSPTAAPSSPSPSPSLPFTSYTLAPCIHNNIYGTVDGPLDFLNPFYL